ncbi:MAG: hypothetical protein IT423_15920 [Pirellulaceae bacterium]|nr:hypothetical protein [Pirellulaceae bacterium]
MTDSAPTPCVLFFSKDIFFAPAVKSAALSAGCQFIIVGNIDAEIAPETIAACRACIVDLTPLSVEQVALTGQKLAERFPTAQRIAFGPHVQVEHFAAAASAGFSPVLAKGQVAHMLPKLLDQ